MTALFERLTKSVSTSAFHLALAAVAIFVALSVVLAFVLFRQTNQVLTDQVLAVLSAESGILKNEAAGGRQALIHAVDSRSLPEGPALYYLTDADGAKLAGNLKRLPPELAGDADGGIFRYLPKSGDGERLAVAIPVDVGNGLRLLIGRDVDDQRRFADSVRYVSLLGFGGLSLLGLLGGLALSRYILNRMDAITQTSQSIMAGDLTRRIPRDGSGSELDALAGNLNEMLDRIEGLMGSLREVSDNIAHDLKTPLNRLRNSAEAALRDPRGGAGYREGLESTIERADELIKTFNALLLIARLEAAPLEESLEQFNLSRLVEDVSELYIPAAEDSGFALSVETGEGPVVRANRQLIGQVLANLIDNAIKYSKRAASGGSIAVRAGNAPQGGAMISVADRGPGIAEKDRQRALKRFVRLEESRTEPGTGLGLSLVAAVARLHGGEIRLEDNEPGLRVVLLLPERVIVQEKQLADA